MARPRDPEDGTIASPLTASQAGFSLVEVLVTLAISALAATLILTTARPADPLRTESERLARTLGQLEGRARMSGSPMGLVIESDRYAGVVWTGEEWAALSRQSHELARGVTIRIPVGRGRAASQGSDESPLPQLVFDPLGHSALDPLVLQANGRELTVPWPTAPRGAAR